MYSNFIQDGTCKDVCVHQYVHAYITFTRRHPIISCAFPLMDQSASGPFYAKSRRPAVREIDVPDRLLELRRHKKMRRK